MLNPRSPTPSKSAVALEDFSCLLVNEPPRGEERG